MTGPDLIHAAGVAVLTVAGTTSLGVIASSIAPQWRRIARLALGYVEPMPGRGCEATGA